MISPAPPENAHPYLRAASAGVRHHTRALAPPDAAQPRLADRQHLDVLHAHLTALLHLLDRLAEATRPPRPAAGRLLATAHTRLWQATNDVHNAFHLLPADASADAEARACRPDHLPDGPPVLTICQRHLAAGHVVRRKTTPADLNTPVPGHATTCSQ
ncbi:DUF6238 family protein [Streptomyces sp. NPDC048305]|uniref:DUF6238 family protein n=1 Tax=Streptomyces sp. NPDC048305 TaxID=3365532 RepID=UPI0037183B92